MPDVSAHPSSQALALFRGGKLPEAQAAAVAAHLEACPDCRRAAATGKAQTASPGGTIMQAGAAPPHAPAPVPDVPPELANHPKFRIVRELGRGGMGVIYLARHCVMDKPVALKVISPAVLDNPTAVGRFLAEVRAAGKLDHPNIARAYDADQAGGLHFLVMEFVEGMSLAQVLEKKGPLPVAHACHFVRQAALGLQHAFEQGMAHRDIKPHNLMLAPKGVVKVLDFGLARLRGERKTDGALTQADAFMGTPEYVAPEQATDARNADTRSDVYSLGCTLYALLTGRPPFVEDTPMKLVLAHIEKEPAPLHELRPDAPAELSAVVAKMLAKEPARRYQKPAEVAQALLPFAKAGGSSGAAATRMGGDTSLAAANADRGAKRPSGKTAVAAPVPEAVPVEPPVWWKRPVVLAGAGGGTVALVALAAVIMLLATRRPADDGASLTKTKPPPSDLRINKDKPAPGPSQPKETQQPEGGQQKGGAAEEKTDPGPGTSPPPSGAPGQDAPGPGRRQEEASNDRPGAAGPAVAEQPDPIRDKLKAARDDFDAKMKKYHDQLVDVLDREKDGAQKAGRFKVVEQIKQQRTAFERDGSEPPTRDGRDYRQKRHAARLALEHAYIAARSEYTKSKMETQAGAVERQRKQLGRNVPLDAFQPGTAWAGKGKIEWLKPGPRPGAKPQLEINNFEATLTVLERDDMKFRARYELRNGNAWEVSGAVTLKGEVVWLARDAKPVPPNQGELKFDLVGQLRDHVLEFKFRGLTKDNKPADGGLVFELKPR